MITLTINPTSKAAGFNDSIQIDTGEQYGF